MKKILASILVIMLLLGCVLFTASCGKKKDNNGKDDDGTTVTPPVDDGGNNGGNQNNDTDTLSGTYYDEKGDFVFIFEGNKLTMQAYGQTVTATYTLGDGTITVKNDNGEDESTSSFEKGDGYIIIDDIRLTTTKPEPKPGLTGGDTILSGTYYDTTGNMQITFDGNKLTIQINGETIHGTYKIADNVMLTQEDGEDYPDDPATFEKGDGYILIDGMKFTTEKPDPSKITLSGTYYHQTYDVSYTFEGDRYTLLSYGNATSGTYSIKDGVLSMTVDGYSFTTTVTFEMGDGYIVLDGDKYTPTKPEPVEIILSGTYYHETEDMAYTFEGNRFTLTGALTFSGTYYIEYGFMYRTRDGGYKDTVSFEMGDGYIILSGVKYTTAKPEPVVPTLEGVYYCEEYAVLFTFDNGSFTQTEANGNDPYTGTYTIADGMIFFDYAEGDDFSLSIVFNDGFVVIDGGVFNKLVNKEGVINGTWHNSNYNVTFIFKDGSFSLLEGPRETTGTYIIENGKLIATNEGDPPETIEWPLTGGADYIMLGEDRFDRVTDTPSVGKNHAILNGIYGNETMTITFEGNQYTTTLLSGGTGAIGTYEIIDSYIVLTPDNGVASPALVFERGSDYISVAGEVYNKISAGTVFEGDLQLSGTYTANIDGMTISFVFNGDNFETKVPAGLTGASGTYVIEGGNITLTYEQDGTVETHSFEYGGSYIKLDSDVFNSESSSTQSALDGTYFYEEGNITLILSGDKFSMIMQIGSNAAEVTGTYTVSDGIITLTPYDTSLQPAEDSFEVGDGYIVFGGATYVKLTPALDGTYSDGNRTITFDNGSFSMTRGENSMYGTYVVSGDTVTLTYPDGFEEELPLIMGDGYIILGGIELRKTEEGGSAPEVTIPEGSLPDGLTGGDAILDGTYYTEDGMAIIFKNNIMIMDAAGEITVGTYKIENGIMYSKRFGYPSIYENPISIVDGTVTYAGMVLSRERPAEFPGLTGGEILDGTYTEATGEFSIIFAENYYLSIAYGTDLLVGTYKYENNVFLMSNPDGGMPTEIDFIKGEGFIIMNDIVFIEKNALLTTEGEILEGAYYDETGDVIFTFVGNTLVVTTMTDDGTSIVIGSYLIESGLITITMGDGADSKGFMIVIGDDYISINGARYTREDPSSGPSIDIPTDKPIVSQILTAGTYQKVESDKDERYSFSGDSFVLTVDGENVLAGTYKIEADTIYFYTDDSGTPSASYALETGEGYISLDGVIYGKVVLLT